MRHLQDSQAVKDVFGELFLRAFAAVKLDEFDVNGIKDLNVRAYVNEGELTGSLLGMSYLRRYEKIIITRDMLRLER